MKCTAKKIIVFVDQMENDVPKKKKENQVVDEKDRNEEDRNAAGAPPSLNVLPTVFPVGVKKNKVKERENEMEDQRGLAEAADGFDQSNKSLVPIRSRPGLIVSWAIVIITLISMYCLGRYGQTYCRDFSWNDETINLPSLESAYPDWTLIIAGLLPVAAAVFLSRMIPIFPGSWKWELHEALLCIGIAYAICRSVIDPVKIYAGRLRPDFLDRVRSLGYNETTTSETHDFCADSGLRVGRISFPSGHSGICFASATLVALLVGNRLRVLAQPAAGYVRLLYFFISVGMLPFAAIVAISRTRTNHHHFTDIVAGMFIGITSAILAFRLQYSLCPKRRCFVPTTLVPPPLPPAVIYTSAHYTNPGGGSSDDEKEGGAGDGIRSPRAVVQNADVTDARREVVVQLHL